MIRILRKIWFLERKCGLRKRIFDEFGGSTDPEEIQVLEFLKKHPQHQLPLGMRPPYDWVDDYKSEDVIVKRDAANGMLYVMSNNHPVFFPKKFSEDQVRESVRIGLMEQDSRSPHCYVGANHMPDQDDIAVFIGASDGMFCLSLIERISKAYLFEPGSHWHEPLKATFAPWREKVEIVPYAAASTDTGDRRRLDTFFSDKPAPNFIQMDVDGAEHDVFAGAEGVLTNTEKLRLSICTYHQRLDFSEFSSFLSEKGFSIGNSPGFFLLGVRKPYFRRGIIYASKGTT